MKQFNIFLLMQVALGIGLPVFLASAQQVVWEKIWGFNGNHEEVGKIIPVQNSTDFLALGKTTKWTQQVGFEYFEAIVLFKINAEGDTIFMKRLGTIPVVWGVYLGHKYGNIYQAVVESPINDNNLPVVYPCILEFTDEGQLLSTKYLTGLPEYRPKTCVKTPDGGLILAGYYNGALSAPTNMMAIKVNFLGEVEWSYQYIPPVQNAGYGTRLEKMANGNFLLSGPLGRRIYGYEIDSNGVQVGQKTYYETPSNRVFWDGAAAQGFWKGSFSYGNYLDGSSNSVGYFGRHDSLGHKIWGGEILSSTVNHLTINKENSFLISRYSSGVNFSRVTKDSIILWNIHLGTGLPRKVVNGICFTLSDTGFAFGFYRQQTGNLGNQFWIAKIAGVGTAYDPANPGDTVTVSVQERLFRPKDSPVLYPNPATETIRFQKLTQETKVAIYSSQGQKLLEQNILPEQVLDICTLPIGTYLYHLKMGERVFTGKFLRK